MKRSTHTVVGAVSGIITYHFLKTYLLLSRNYLVSMVFLGGFFGILPDFDLLLGRRYHRSGVSHSLLSAGLCSSVVLILVSIAIRQGMPLDMNSMIAYPLTALFAYSSHVLIDSLTDAGAPLFWPIDQEDYSFTEINSDNPYLNGIIIILCMIFLAYWLYPDK